MGLIDRILRVIRANINNLLGNAEDPEKILEQTVLEMQENLVLLRQSVAQAIATQKRTDRQANQAQSNAEEWYRRVQLALQQGNDSLAREALTKRKFYQETATALVTQMEPHKIVVDRLKTDMQTLSNKISEAKTKKDMFIARARSAQASANINEILGGVNPRSSLNAFERMEEKVMEIEAQSAAIAELGTDDLQQKFASLEAGGEIDSELAAMKQQMITGDNPHKQLPKS
ncbi:MAG: PspA/IM30 family protein [Nostocaceae cyanobacterium]|nr:PspA/IM30 family protein [Nostocaceae cyanobacterium]